MRCMSLVIITNLHVMHALEKDVNHEKALTFILTVLFHAYIIERLL